MSNLADIDINKLDEAWVEHVQKVAEVALAIPKAKKRANKAKADMELIEAELKHEIRSDPVTYQLKSKPSNPEVDATVLMQDSYKEAQRKYLSARENVDHLDAAMTVLEHRKRALEDLVKLFGMNYFSKPSVDMETQRQAREVFEKVDESSGFKRRRKK